MQPGDKVIVISYGVYTDAEAREHQPTVVVLDEVNRPHQIVAELAHTTTADALAG